MTPDDIIAEYRSALGDVGVEVFIRRYAGLGATRVYQEKKVLALVRGFEAHELVGPIQQGDRQAILLHDDLTREQFPLPITANDKIVIDGRECAIISPDRHTRKVQDVVIAYQLIARGQ